MRRNKLYWKLNFIVNNCGTGNIYSLNYNDVGYVLGLSNLIIYEDERGYVIEYGVPYKNTIQTKYIHIHMDGKKVYIPARRSILDFKIASNVMNYVQTALYRRAKIKYLSEMKRFVIKFNEEKNNTKDSQENINTIELKKELK